MPIVTTRDIPNVDLVSGSTNYSTPVLFKDFAYTGLRNVFVGGYFRAWRNQARDQRSLLVSPRDIYLPEANRTWRSMFRARTPAAELYRLRDSVHVGTRLLRADALPTYNRPTAGNPRHRESLNVDIHELTEKGRSALSSNRRFMPHVCIQQGLPPVVKWLRVRNSCADLLGDAINPGDPVYTTIIGSGGGRYLAATSEDTILGFCDVEGHHRGGVVLDATQVTPVVDDQDLVRNFVGLVSYVLDASEENACTIVGLRTQPYVVVSPPRVMQILQESLARLGWDNPSWAPNRLLR